MSWVVGWNDGDGLNDTTANTTATTTVVLLLLLLIDIAGPTDLVDEHLMPLIQRVSGFKRSRQPNTTTKCL